EHAVDEAEVLQAEEMAHGGGIRSIEAAITGAEKQCCRHQRWAAPAAEKKEHGRSDEQQGRPNIAQVADAVTEQPTAQAAQGAGKSKKRSQQIAPGDLEIYFGNLHQLPDKHQPRSRGEAQHEPEENKKGVAQQQAQANSGGGRSFILRLFGGFALPG